ncbi:hypothetical protein G6F59_016330 [Rhizopus arrhizus]|nr:hypothetical protein G6F59_016330 [Rhizopus arrhizus]
MQLESAEYRRTGQAAQGLGDRQRDQEGDHVVHALLQCSGDAEHDQRAHEHAGADRGQELADVEVVRPVQAGAVLVEEGSGAQQQDRHQQLGDQPLRTERQRRRRDAGDHAGQDHAEQGAQLVRAHAQRTHQVDHAVGLLGAPAGWPASASAAAGCGGSVR